MKNKILKAVSRHARRASRKVVKHRASVLIFADWLLHDVLDWGKDAVSTVMKEGFSHEVFSIPVVVVLLVAGVAIVESMGGEGDGCAQAFERQLGHIFVYDYHEIFTG